MAKKKSPKKKAAQKKAKKSSAKKAKKKPEKKPKKKTVKKAAKKSTKPTKTKKTAPALVTMEQSDSTAAEIVKRIREALSPTTLSLANLSHAHKNHPGAKKHGGGHYSLEVVSEGFMGLGPVDRQRWIMALVRDLMEAKKIHALQMDLKDPREVPLKDVLVAPLREQPKKVREE